MGFTPQQVNAMSIWQFMAVCDGFSKSRDNAKGKISGSEVDELWAWISEGNTVDAAHYSGVDIDAAVRFLDFNYSES
jgi:hypothetical protein